MTRVALRDVSPRDGLQSRTPSSPAATRAVLVERLAVAGVPRIEIGSFVNPKRVPQMAGAEEVAAALPADRARLDRVGLVLNERGYDRLASCGLPHVAFAVPVTDAYLRAQPGRRACEPRRWRRRPRSPRAPAPTAARSRSRSPSRSAARSAVPSRPTTCCAWPSASWPPAPTSSVVADTIGVAVPRQVRSLVASLAELGLPVGAHLHNTRNTGYANALAAVEAGASSLDASVGGIGGCPFAPRATGNIATEDLAYLLRGEGVETGVDIEALIARRRVARDDARPPAAGRAAPGGRLRAGGRRGGLDARPHPRPQLGRRRHGRERPARRACAAPRATAGAGGRRPCARRRARRRRSRDRRARRSRTGRCRAP